MKQTLLVLTCAWIISGQAASAGDPWILPESSDRDSLGQRRQAAVETWILPAEADETPISQVKASHVPPGPAGGIEPSPARPYQEPLPLEQANEPGTLPVTGGTALQPISDGKVVPNTCSESHCTVCQLSDDDDEYGCFDLKVLLGGACPACGITTGDLFPHYPYPPAFHGYYYFRPYNYRNVLEDQQTIHRLGGRPESPYSTEMFEPVYERNENTDYPGPETARMPRLERVTPRLPDLQEILGAGGNAEEAPMPPDGAAANEGPAGEQTDRGPTLETARLSF